MVKKNFRRYVASACVAMSVMYGIGSAMAPAVLAESVVKNEKADGNEKNENVNENDAENKNNEDENNDTENKENDVENKEDNKEDNKENGSEGTENNNDNKENQEEGKSDAEGEDKVKEYSLTVDPAGGKFADGSSDAKTAKDKLVEGNDILSDINDMIPSRDGYKLKGFVDGSGNKVYDENGSFVEESDYWNNGMYTGTSDLSVSADWEAAYHVLTVSLDGGNVNGSSEDLSMDIQFGSDAGSSLGAAVVKEGFVLDGFVDDNGKMVYDENGRAVDGDYWKDGKLVHDGDIHVTAKWSVLTVSALFSADNTNPVINGEVNHSASITFHQTGIKPQVVYTPGSGLIPQEFSTSSEAYLNGASVLIEYADGSESVSAASSIDLSKYNGITSITVTPNGNIREGMKGDFSIRLKAANALASDSTLSVAVEGADTVSENIHTDIRQYVLEAPVVSHENAVAAFDAVTEIALSGFNMDSFGTADEYNYEVNVPEFMILKKIQLPAVQGAESISVKIVSEGEEKDLGSFASGDAIEVNTNMVSKVSFKIDASKEHKLSMTAPGSLVLHNNSSENRQNYFGFRASVSVKFGEEEKTVESDITGLTLELYKASEPQPQPQPQPQPDPEQEPQPQPQPEPQKEPETEDPNEALKKLEEERKAKIRAEAEKSKKESEEKQKKAIEERLAAIRASVSSDASAGGASGSSSSSSSASGTEDNQKKELVFRPIRDNIIANPVYNPLNTENTDLGAG